MAARDVGYGLGVFLQNLVPGLRYAMDKADKEAMMAKQMGMKERQMAGEQAFRKAQLEIQKGEAESKDRRRSATAEAEGKKLDPELELLKARKGAAEASAGYRNQQAEESKTRVDFMRANQGLTAAQKAAIGKAGDADAARKQKRIDDEHNFLFNKVDKAWDSLLKAAGNVGRANTLLFGKSEMIGAMSAVEEAAIGAFKAAVENYRQFAKRKLKEEEWRSLPGDVQQTPEPKKSLPSLEELDKALDLDDLEKDSMMMAPQPRPEFLLTPQQQELRRRLERAQRFSGGMS